MTVVDLLTELRDRDVRLEADGDRLLVDAPVGVLTDDVRQLLADHKAELLAALQREATGAGREQVDADLAERGPAASPWCRNPNGPGWVETPEAVGQCVFCPRPLRPGDLLCCAEHRARMNGIP